MLVASHMDMRANSVVSRRPGLMNCANTVVSACLSRPHTTRWGREDAPIKLRRVEAYHVRRDPHVLATKGRRLAWPLNDKFTIRG